MANSPQTIKRARQNEKRHTHNKSLRSDMRTKLKKVLKALTSEDKSQLVALYRSAASSLDRLARKRLLHPNKAARLKSRLNAKVKAVS